jgi:hypothetical protein
MCRNGIPKLKDLAINIRSAVSCIIHLANTSPMPVNPPVMVPTVLNFGFRNFPQAGFETRKEVNLV